MANKIITLNRSEPLGDAKMARFDIDTCTGNLTINQLPNSASLLASGMLEYPEKQDPPAWNLDVRDGLSTLVLKGTGSRQPGFRLPWAAYNGETSWQVQINPSISTEITAHSGGGNMKINLARMTITRVSADSGGGNLDLTLPDSASDLSVTAKSGGGNITVELGRGTTGRNTITATTGAGKVIVRLSPGLPAFIHADTGLGKVTVDPQYSLVEKNTYRSPGYDTAVDRVEINASSGAGNVSIITI